MSDVIDYALMRHGELAEAIKKHENEIQKLLEEKESLEHFVCTHKELSERAASTIKPSRSAEVVDHKDREAKANQPIPQIMPVRQAKPA